MMNLRMGKKIHLCDYETDSLAEDLSRLFDRKVELARIRQGNKQTIDTLISEEATLLGMYLKKEKAYLCPRLVSLANTRVG